MKNYLRMKQDTSLSAQPYQTTHPKNKCKHGKELVVAHFSYKSICIKNCHGKKTK